MAKEIKRLTVHPNDEAQTIRAYQSFGWILLYNQEVYSKDSHLESWGRKTYSVTQTTNYVKLTFERDATKLKHYNELRQLENAYYAIQVPKKPAVAEKSTKVCVYALCALPGLVVMLADFLKGLCCLAGFCGLFFFIDKLQRSRVDTWKAAYRKCWEKRERIIQQTDRYL